ncbi:hypothetical protein [Flavobacterium sp. 140616W15]|uniref:hypothetical protein n=1 Tax=Flavobacterium sp. 140616W15 TaxID=2478552 RepID=UPI000F0C24AB|nr:hypothetical protein [Flavobacterium sp. 140616W15]AYN04785.1 hypothetical protein EAG11_11890 [Flavobacterium sp. 140616W15]
MTGNIFTDHIDNLDLIEKNNEKSKKQITHLKETLDLMSRQLKVLSDQSQKERLFGLYKTIDTETLLEMINSQTRHTSTLINSISQISSISNENIVDINKMMRILLSISQSIYSDIVTNNKTSEEIYNELKYSKSIFLKHNDQFNLFIESTINRAVNDKKRYQKLDSRLNKLEKTGLVEKNTKLILGGFIFLSMIILGLATFIIIKL